MIVELPPVLELKNSTMPELSIVAWPALADNAVGVLLN